MDGLSESPLFAESMDDATRVEPPSMSTGVAKELKFPLPLDEICKHKGQDRALSVSTYEGELTPCHRSEATPSSLCRPFGSPAAAKAPSVSSVATTANGKCQARTAPSPSTPGDEEPVVHGPPSRTQLEVSLQKFRYLGKTKRLAHCPQDILLCWKLCTMIGLEENVPAMFISMLFRTVRLLHRCGYHTHDIVTVGSHAVVYSTGVLQHHSGKMDWSEAAYMVGLQMYIAHSYLMDEHCPLNIWHKFIFAEYCDIKVLNQACIELLRLRRFLLHVPCNEARRVHSELLSAVHAYRMNKNILEIGP